MSTTTSVPEVKKTNPVSLTPSAISKVKEIMAQQNPIPQGFAWESSVEAAPDFPTPCSLKTPPAPWTRSMNTTI